MMTESEMKQLLQQDGKKVEAACKNYCQMMPSVHYSELLL